MKKTTVMAMMAFVVISATKVQAADNTSATPMPHLSLDSAYIDMGVVRIDSIGSATMHFRNTGDAPLQIMRIYSDCGCTVPSYSSDEVSPGETGEIRISFNGKNRQPGTFRKTLRIRSNADNPRETLVVKGLVK